VPVVGIRSNICKMSSSREDNQFQKRSSKKHKERPEYENSRHVLQKVRKTMNKDKREKYKRYDEEDFYT
jgi:hypothetical protein